MFTWKKSAIFLCHISAIFIHIISEFQSNISATFQQYVKESNVNAIENAALQIDLMKQENKAARTIANQGVMVVASLAQWKPQSPFQWFIEVYEIHWAHHHWCFDCLLRFTICTGPITIIIITKFIGPHPCQHT